MTFFITFLRALAACLITNSHYTGIYPSNIIANGGLIGDTLFFAISGYCLYNIKYDLTIKGFGLWYRKRIWRIYPSVIIITAVYVALGFYSLSKHSFFWWFIYPTYYHFVASIIVLYIPFFFIMKIEFLRKNIVPIMVGIAVLWLVVYFTFYDKSYYHIDTVREPMIRFLFMESMLLGAWFRQNDDKYRNINSIANPIITAISFIIYFISKFLFSRIGILASLQFINQITIFVLLVFVFRTFCGFDNELEKMPDRIKTIVKFISEMTLEIYVVQYVIIDEIRNLDLFFPLNWVLITAAIFVAAYFLHILSKLVRRVSSI